MKSIVAHIMFCLQCRQYTLKEKCPRCMSVTHDPKPVKFSPEDRYGKYRRMAKMEKIYESECGGVENGSRDKG